MNRFQTVLEKAESYLIASKEFETAEKLAFADKFRLNILLARFFRFLILVIFINACLNAHLLSIEKKIIKYF